jgi:helix-turn-helix protein
VNELDTLLGSDRLDRILEDLARRFWGSVEALEQRERANGWMDMNAAAKYAGTTVSALRRAVRDGEIDAKQRDHGHKLFFKRSAIDDWHEGR